jgi:hypothetical protein
MTYSLPKGSSGDAVLAGVEYLGRVGEAGREDLHTACCEGSGLSRTMSEWLVTKTNYGGCPVDVVWEKYPKKWGDGRRVGYKLTEFGMTLLGIYDPPGRRLRERLAKKEASGIDTGVLVRIRPRAGCYTFDLVPKIFSGVGRNFVEYETSDNRLGVVVGWAHFYNEGDKEVIFGSYVEGDEESRERWSGSREPFAVVLMPEGVRMLAGLSAISIAKSGGKR